MAQLNANLPYTQCFIRNKYIFPKDDGCVTEGYIFGCKSMLNRPMHFHFQSCFGAIFWMMPISAFLSSKEIMSHFNSGSHGSTFGGNPLASKVATKALELLYKDSLIENSKILGDYFISALKSIDNKIIKEVRGKGLWIGMELNKSKINAKDLCLMLLNEGLLCKETHKSVIRFAPPLMISKDQLDWAINKIIRVISSI